ncbi:MAG: DNA polymerase IV [Nitrosopumilales archaeon]|nr:MAG: DNA polymerase IV [Nitrosopumilales archaeon]
MNDRVILHIDFDYFFAQCEELRSPELRTRPVCVCVFSDRGGDSGAIATANYVARKYGVKSGLPIRFAKKRLEGVSNATFLPTDFEYYSEISGKAMDIIKEYADIFEYVGKDEAYLDVSKRTEGSFDKASHLAQQIKNSVRGSVKLTCSIGISPNKLVSKIASDFQKPDGLTVVPPDKVQTFLDPLPIRAIPGIGKKTEDKFSEPGLESVSQLKKLDVFSLTKQFGRKMGTYIYNSIRGIDEEPVAERPDAKQYSRIVTLRKDSKDYDFLAKSIETLCKDIHSTVLKNNIMFKSIGIQFVQTDLANKTKSRMLKNPTSSLEEMQKAALQLLRDALQGQDKLVRRIGVKVSDLYHTVGQDTLTRYF